MDCVLFMAWNLQFLWPDDICSRSCNIQWTTFTSLVRLYKLIHHHHQLRNAQTLHRICILELAFFLSSNHFNPSLLWICPPSVHLALLHALDSGNIHLFRPPHEPLILDHAVRLAHDLFTPRHHLQSNKRHIFPIPCINHHG